VFFVYGFWQTGFFTIDRVWNTDNYREVWGDPFYRSLLFRTVATGLLVAAVTVPLAYAVAYVVTFSLRRGRQTVVLLILGSMLSSYLVRIYAWKSILGPTGVINDVLDRIGLIDQPLGFLLYSRFALVITLISILLPYAILPIFAALQNVDRDMIRASRDLGAGSIESFIRVTLPLSRRGVVTAFLFTFILAAGDYVTPQLVGGRSGLMVGRVVADQFGVASNWPLASALSFSLLALLAATVGALWLAGRLTSAAVSFAGQRISWPAGEPRIPGATLLPWGHFYIGAVLLFLFAPLVIVAVLSFDDSRIPAFPMSGFTLDWYSEVIAGDTFRSALRNTLVVGVATALIDVAIGTPAAFALARRRFLLRTPLSALLLLPLALPGIVLGVSILTAVDFAGRGTSLRTVVLSHVVFTLPFLVLVMTARLRDFDRQVEDAARDLGCSQREALRRVTLPIVAPTLVGATLLVFALSLDEFVITNFTIGAEATVPVMVWSMLRLGITPAVNAIATLIVLASLIVMVIAATLLRLRAHAALRTRGLV
jgi:spermidine/putrescine transport system permease protein